MGYLHDPPSEMSVAILITSNHVAHAFISIYIQPSAPKFIVLVSI